MEKIIEELQAASMWFEEHGKNTNTAIVGICARAIDHINRQEAEIERLKERADRHLYNLKAVLDARRADTRRIIEEFADIIVENYPEMEYFINNLVKEFAEGEKK